MKYFIFDVDGTLLNSAEVDQQCLKQTLHEFGRDYTFEELRPSFGKPGRQTLADLGFTGETAERIMDRWEGLSKERASEVLAFDGIEALLRELRGLLAGTGEYSLDFGDGTTQQGYIVLRPVSMTYRTSTYEQSRAIIDRLSASDNINRISDLSIRRDERSGGQGYQTVLTVTYFEVAP